MNKLKNLGTALMVVGLLFFFGALGLIGYNYYNEFRAEKVSKEILDILSSESKSTNSQDSSILPDYIINPDMEMPKKVIDGTEYIGRIEITSKSLSLPVISEWSVNNFKYAPCRYEGTPYKNDFIIAAHNYRGHFAELKNLIPGDSVIFTDMDNNRFIYKVMYTEVLDKTAVDEMSEGEWDLTLFTCTYGGATRVTVRCKLLEAVPG